MPFVWLVDCKTCLQRFAVLPREVTSKDHSPGSESETRSESGRGREKSTSALPPHEEAGTFECPHCHEVHTFENRDLIPGEGRIIHQ
jgi:DNA-directed RNA polymerase subunit M/transcription elongation factor TFIIS